MSENLDLPGNPTITVSSGGAGTGNATVAPITGVVNPPIDHARVRLLREAAALITGDREQDYGSPQDNFARIATLWNVQLAKRLAPGEKFTPTDVALAMVQVKLARAIQTPTEDSFKDAAGYIALAFELSQDD